MCTSCRIEENESLNNNADYDNIITKVVDNNIVNNATETFLSTSIDYEFYYKNNRFPESFTVYNDSVFIIDTLNSTILKFKSEKLISRTKLSFPFSDMIDIYAIDENDYYIFNYPLERGIYLFKDSKRTKIESDLYNYNKYTKISVFGNNLLIGNGEEYLNLDDGFKNVKKNPWNIECQEPYLIDLDSGKKFKVFTNNNMINVLGRHSNYIFIEEFLEFDSIDKRKRFLNILSTDKNIVLSIEIQKNEQSINRDLLIDKEYNLYQMTFTYNAINIEKIDLKELGIE